LLHALEEHFFLSHFAFSHAGFAFVSALQSPQWAEAITGKAKVVAKMSSVFFIIIVVRGSADLFTLRNR
ncbi:MAG: hypothetical protein ACPIA7_03960, partial [Akkermansiaceae bacterium]